MLSIVVCQGKFDGMGGSFNESLFYVCVYSGFILQTEKNRVAMKGKDRRGRLNIYERRQSLLAI